MNNNSLTIAGIFAFVLGRMAQAAGWTGETVTEENLQSLIHAAGILLQIFGVLAAWFGRFRKGDITWYGKRILRSNVIDSLPDGQIR